MRVLVAYGSKRGGTEGIARRIGDTLVERGLDADVARSRTPHDRPATTR